MNIVAYEGVVENGTIRLPPSVVLPEKTLVYVVVRDAAPELKPSVIHLLPPRQPVHIRSPRLTHPELAKKFALEVVPEDLDAEQ